MVFKKKKAKKEETEVKAEIETKKEDQPVESLTEESAPETESDSQRVTLVAEKDTKQEKEEPGEEKKEIISPPPEEEKENKGSGDFKKYLIISLIIGLVVALVGGGIFVYTRTLNLRKASLSTPEVTPTPEPIPTETLEVSPAAQLNREDLAIQVLNGRGVPGTAADAKEFLEELGYLEVDTSNADNYDYEETIIQIKEDKTDYLDLLTEDLSTDYTVSDQTETLGEDEDFDAIIIIGKE